MRGLFDLNSPLMRQLSKLSDLIVLNFLAILCSLPIVTIGAASSALYYAVGRMIREEGTAVKDFWKAFKENLKPGILLWLIFLGLGAVLVIAVLFYGSNQVPARQLCFALSCLMLIIWAFCLSWVFPLLSRFSNTIGGFLRNAATCAVGFLPRTLLMTVINIIPLFLFFFLPNVWLWAGFAWIAFWFSLATYWNCLLIKKPFDIIIGKTEEADSQDLAEK